MKVPRLVAACAAVALLAPSAAAAATQEEIDQSVAEGVAWMRTQQNVATGQISGFGGDYALSALAAAGVHAADVGAPSAQDFYAGLWAGQIAPSSTAILFGHAAGLDVQRLSESTNLVAQIAAAYNRGGELDGSFGNGATNVNAFTALALARVGVPAGVLAKANGYLRGQQHLDGGWGVGRVSTDAQRAAAGSVDMTGTVLAALCETGAAANDPDVRAGLSFLEGRQDPATGGFGNVDSTGWALSGLNACGVAPQGGRFTTSASLTPVDYLLSQQDASGAFLFSGAPNLYSTQNAVRALAGEAFSADPPRRATAADPRFRAVPAVADGTPTPHVLAIDDGAGDVRLCSVTAPAGADARHAARRRPLRHVVRRLGRGRHHDRRPPERLAAAPQPHAGAVRVGDARHRLRRHGRPARLHRLRGPAGIARPGRHARPAGRDRSRRRPRPARASRPRDLRRALAPARHVPRQEHRERAAGAARPRLRHRHGEAPARPPRAAARPLHAAPERRAQAAGHRALSRATTTRAPGRRSRIASARRSSSALGGPVRKTACGELSSRPFGSNVSFGSGGGRCICLWYPETGNGTFRATRPCAAARDSRFDPSGITTCTRP